MASQPAVAPSCRAGFASASQFLPSISCSSLCFAGSSSLTLALEESPLTLRVSNLAFEYGFDRQFQLTGTGCCS